MRENLVIREKGNRFNLRIDDTWHNHRSYDEARLILENAGLDPFKMLAEAVREPNFIHLEYRHKGWGRRSWRVNGRPQPVAVVRFLLSEEEGCDEEIIEAVIRAEKLCYRIEMELKQG